MSDQRARSWSRREFLGGLTLAGTAGLPGLRPRSVAAEPPPEMTRIRLHKMAGICIAPQYVGEEFLYLEGFPEVQYVEVEISGVLRHTKLLRNFNCGSIAQAIPQPLSPVWWPFYGGPRFPARERAVHRPRPSGREMGCDG